MTETISILGCGWLGTPLATALRDSGHAIKGSTTQPDKMDELAQLGITGYCFTVAEAAQYPVDFFETDRLVITLPFRRSFTDPMTYVAMLRSLIPMILASPIQHIVFTSSTGIYPSNCGRITEVDTFEPDTKRAAALLAAESLFRDLAIPSTICRLGGLIGPDREPGKFLARKHAVPNPDGPVNLIWLADCLQIMNRLLTSAPTCTTLNCVGDDHPSRRRFYTRCATQLGLVPPTFQEQTIQTPKYVDNQRVKDLLNIEFMPLFS